ncbi:MAG: hypothetical protein JNM66_21560 [Bryobacterales bacterium]|nr:hypothetical protein [Bryobacterales bacterium]
MILTVSLLVVSLAPWPDPFDGAFLYGKPRAAKAEEVEFRPAPARAWVLAVRQMKEDAPAKQQYVQFLKELYGYNIGKLNEAYGLNAGSFTELLNYDYRRLELNRPAVERDDASFLKILTQAAVDAARHTR